MERSGPPTNFSNRRSISPSIKGDLQVVMETYGIGNLTSTPDDIIADMMYEWLVTYTVGTHARQEYYRNLARKSLVAEEQWAIQDNGETLFINPT